jgi:beta-N-acetylhexosaminidase
MRRELPFVMVSHAAFPAVTKERIPASLSKKWITDILRKKIGYRGLICSDDLEMDGVLKAAPIEQAAIGHIRAGGDLGLICHQEDFIVRAYEAMIREAERDRKFARRVEESSRRVLAFKKHWKPRRVSAPTMSFTDKLKRQLWEFTEEIRLATLARQERPA